jgi:hypothetical protein
LALVTTIGSKLATSFATVAEADAYLTGIGIYTLTAWNALSSARKELFLIHAAIILNNEFTWGGWPVYTNQALPFPRWYTTEDTIEVPEAIKQAQSYIAYAICYKRSLNVSNPADGPSNSPDITSMSVFGISMSAGSTPSQPADSSVLEAVTQTEHMFIYNLLKKYEAGVTCIPGPEGPTPLDEVA